MGEFHDDRTQKDFEQKLPRGLFASEHFPQQFCDKLFVLFTKVAVIILTLDPSGPVDQKSNNNRHRNWKLRHNYESLSW